MDGVSNEVFIGAASLVILLVSTLYFALQQRPQAPQRPAPQPPPAPPQPASAGANAGQAAAERIRAAEAPPPPADDDADAIALNLRIGEGRPVRHRVARHSTVGELRQQLFANEIASGLLVRLIYNGQLLDDAQTFARLGVLNESYIICHIAVPDGEARGNPPRQQVLDRFGGWLHVWVICGFLLATLWGLCFAVPELFTNMTVVMLDMLTVGLTAWIVLTMRANQIAPPAEAPQPQAPQH